MDELGRPAGSEQIGLTVEVVAAYVSHNPLPWNEMPMLIANVHAALGRMSGPHQPENAPVERATPAQIRKSVTPDHLVSFEDGKPYKTLRRHLTLRGLSPESYREKWGLPRDYPMTAAAYSAQRSELARSLGLGQQRRRATAEQGTPAPAAPGKPRGRKRPAGA